MVTKRKPRKKTKITTRVSRHSPATIQEAKELFEQGFTDAMVAKKLNLPRPMTVFDWRKKYGWKRLKKMTVDGEQEEIFKTIADKALDYLQGKTFSSMSEALKIYKDAMHCLEITKKRKDPDSKTGIFEALGFEEGDLDEESEEPESTGLEDTGLESDIDETSNISNEATLGRVVATTSREDLEDSPGSKKLSEPEESIKSDEMENSVENSRS